MSRLHALGLSVLLLVALEALPGCATWLNLEDYREYRGGKSPERLLTPAGRRCLWVYGGTISSVAMIPWHFKAGPPFAWLIFVDPPICFAVDTVILPLTIARQVADPPGEEDGELRVSREFEPAGVNTQGLREYRHRMTGILFVRLPGGKFTMGGTAAERREALASAPEDVRELLKHDLTREKPRHGVTLSPFLIAKHEVTQAQWQKVMGTSPSRFQGDDLPVERVSWEECQEFCRRTGLRLPTEAEWEYACRAWTTGPWSGTGRLDDMGWYGGNSDAETHPVGRKAANGFGLHDLHGNVWEWCQDDYDADFYWTEAANRRNPVCTAGHGVRVSRGGCWLDDAWLCRSATRFWHSSDARSSLLGFRPSWRP